MLFRSSIVSSTRIRALLLAGDVTEANRLLAEPYALCEPVVHGMALGAKLGFPTINQRYRPGMLLPQSGIYITRATIGGKTYAAATGLGDRPTVGGTDITCESFLIGFDGSLYGDDVRLEFFSRIAPVRRFDTLDELRDCIAAAARAAAAYFAGDAAAPRGL